MIYLFGALVVLQILDALTTIEALKYGGIEANPFLNKMFQKIGVIPALVITKVVIMTITWFYLPVISTYVFLFIIIAYIAVVINNIRVIRKIKK